MNQAQDAGLQSKKNNFGKVERATNEPSPEVAHQEELPDGLVRAARAASVQVQAAQLSDKRLQSSQRFALAGRIGRLQGNYYVQRVMGFLQRETESSEGAGGMDIDGPAAALPSYEARFGSPEGAPGTVTLFHPSTEQALAGHTTTLRSKSAPPSALPAVGSSFPAVRCAVGRVLQRDKPTDDSTKPPKPDPATLANPFDAPAVKAEVEKLAVDRLRELTGTLVNQRYASYLNAVDTAARELDVKEKEEKEKDKLVVNAVLSIGLLATGPAMAAIASEISGDKLLTRVKDGVASNGPRWVKLAGIDDADAAKYLTNDAYEKLSGDTLKNLAAKFSTEKATKAVEFAADKLKDKTAELTVSTNKYACGAAYLEALKDSADASSTELLHTVQGMTSYDELLGVYNAFNAMSLSKFREQVKVQANNFMEQIAPLLAEKAAQKQGFGAKGFRLVRVNAYGKPRLALVIYSPSSATNIFKAWITPDMEKTAIASYSAPSDVDASTIVGLTDPLRQEGKQRLVKIDAWGKLRLALIQVKDAGIITTELFYDFIRWIPESERADMESRAESTQIGGLMTLPASDVKNLKQPTD